MSTIMRETLVPTDWVLYIEVRRGIEVGIPTGTISTIENRAQTGGDMEMMRLVYGHLYFLKFLMLYNPFYLTIACKSK